MGYIDLRDVAINLVEETDRDGDINDIKSHLLGTSGPGTILSTLHVLTHLFLMTTPCAKYYY